MYNRNALCLDRFADLLLGRGRGPQGFGKQRRCENGDEKMLRHAFVETTRRKGNRQIRVEFKPLTEDSLVEPGIFLQPGGFRFQALCDCGIVNADELADCALQHFAILCWILAAGLLLSIQARDRDRMTLPNNYRARVNGIVQA